MSNPIESQSEKKMSSGDDLNQDFKTDESIDLGVLHLNPDHHHHRHSSHSRCSSCGCNGTPSSAAKSNKRRSTESIPLEVEENPFRKSPMQLPKRPKRLVFDPPESLSSFSIPPGFSKITLPPAAAQPESAAPPGYFKITLPPTAAQPESAANPNLRRSPLQISGSDFGTFSQDLTRQSPPPDGTRNVETNDSSATPSSKAAGTPPLPPLRRAWSLPSPKNPERSTSSDVVVPQPQLHVEKLKVIGDCIKELAKWLDERQTVEEIKPVNNKQEEEVSGDDDSAKQDGSETAGCEESVNVERTAECLIINFKCPCKKGYQILLSGTSCYYKLI